MPALPVPGDVLGRHRITRELGQGPDGASFLAEPSDGSEAVVLKALVEKEPLTVQSRDAIAEDFRALAGLRSDRIITPKAARNGDGIFWLIYPYQAGGSLAEHLAEGGRLERADAVAVCNDIATALAAAHSIGITHGGVKPTNVFLAADETGLVARLSDFGGRLRAVDWEGSPEARLAQSEYAAPETLVNGEISARSDLYSLGCLLHVMLVGRTSLAVAKDSLGATIAIPENDAVDRDLNVLLAALLHGDPAHRPLDAAAVRESLTSLGQQVHAEPAAVVVPEKPADASTPDPLVVAAAAMDGSVPVSPAAADRRGTSSRLPRALSGRTVIAAAVAAVVVVGGAVWLLNRDNTSPASNAVEPTATPAASATTGAAAVVKVRAQPAYRAVRFRVDSGDKAAQVRRDGSWRAVRGGTVIVPTTKGSQQACVQVRIAGTTSTTKSCGQSQAPALGMDPVGACTISGTSYDHCYELTLAGFAPGSVKVQSAAADAQGVMQHYTDDVTIDNTGHGRDPARFGTSKPATVQISVDGVVKSLSIG